MQVTSIRVDYYEYISALTDKTNIGVIDEFVKFVEAKHVRAPRVKKAEKKLKSA